MDESLERDIVTAFIVSEDYIRRVREGWDSSLLVSDPARHLVNWCMEFYDSYGRAPTTSIRSIFEDKLLKGRINSDIAREIEEEILPSLEKDNVGKDLNIDYLVRETKKYTRLQDAKKLDKILREHISKGEADEAENLILNYAPRQQERQNEIDLKGKEFEQRLYDAFNQTHKNLLYYPGAMGDMVNRHLVRGGFVAFMGVNKSGKTFQLLDMALRAYRQGNSVAFFQAGDMTENDFMIRGSTYLTRLPYYSQDVGENWQPRKDCIWNQIDKCEKPERESDFGVFNSMREDLSDYYNWLSRDNLIEAYNKYPEYHPCRNCLEWRHKPWGTVWLEKNNINRPLNFEEAKQGWKDYLSEHNEGFRVATYSNSTLSVPAMESRLKLWEKEGFRPGVIVLDYADYLVSNDYKEFRHQQNDVWRRLRGLSQQGYLVITVTQADAQAFDSKTLKRKNFSEDRRKFDHPTAFFGINTDPQGVEKQLGIVRLNELALREGYFDSIRQVAILQNLTIGRPFIGSYWYKM